MTAASLPGARPDVASSIKQQYEVLGGWKSELQLPIVYSPAYNVKLFGLEKLHPFDACKYEKVKRALETQRLINAAQLVAAVEVSRAQLLDLHTQEYIDALGASSQKLQEVTEAPLLRVLPNWIIQSRLHRPMRYHVGGTMLALALALEHGWAINLGGGMHHAHAENGSGWCAYDDWMLALRMLRRTSAGRFQNALYIDLDVHQGNGVARDKLRTADVGLYILDMFNRELWPGDAGALAGIDRAETFACGCGDVEYLGRLRPALAAAFATARPDIVLYNAGTDVLDGDPLGRCRNMSTQVSAKAVVERDELVWQAAIDHGVPICMALSGGYAKGSAGVISQCLSHLLRHFELIRPT